MPGTSVGSMASRAGQVGRFGPPVTAALNLHLVYFQPPCQPVVQARDSTAAAQSGLAWRSSHTAPLLLGLLTGPQTMAMRLPARLSLLAVHPMPAGALCARHTKARGFPAHLPHAAFPASVLGSLSHWVFLCPFPQHFPARLRSLAQAAETLLDPGCPWGSNSEVSQLLPMRGSEQSES